MELFMIYSRATVGGGAVVKSTSSGGGTTATSSSGGGTTATSSSGGGVAKSTASGGGSSQTSSSGGGSTATSSFTAPSFFKATSQPYAMPSLPPYADHIHHVNISTELNHSHTISVPNHTHSVSVPSHSHDFDIPNHNHSVTVPAHSHSVTVPNHAHEINLPNHNHDIEHGIYEYPTLPTAVQITVDGNALPTTATSGERIDILPYLKKDSSGNIERGRYAEIKIAPNGLARINANVSSRLFIQSRKGVVM